jgi:hypothetical protein
LFGAAGMLGKDITLPYVTHLKSEFEFLRRKYNLKPMPALQWKFMRMRPAHFPTIRIAQLAALITGTDYFIAKIEDQASATDWIRLVSVTPANEFWDTHYHFTAVTPATQKHLGSNTAITLVINVVAPLMFIYGKNHGKAALKEYALQLLEELPPEKNAVITGWKGCGWRARDAGQSQAMLYLKKNYCERKRCLHCAIGMQVIK